MHWHQIKVYALSLALSKTVTRPISYTVNSFLSSNNDLKGTYFYYYYYYYPKFVIHKSSSGQGFWREENYGVKYSKTKTYHV